MRAIPERQAVAALAVSLSCSLMAAPARAQIEPVRLVYQAYAECPNEARFVHEVEAHIEHARPAVGDAACQDCSSDGGLCFDLGAPDGSIPRYCGYGCLTTDQPELCNLYCTSATDCHSP